MSPTRSLFRPAGAPAYYLGRPATAWLNVLGGVSDHRSSPPLLWARRAVATTG